MACNLCSNSSPQFRVERKSNSAVIRSTYCLFDFLVLELDFLNEVEIVITFKDYAEQII